MRGYDEWVASVSDVVPLPVLLLVMFGVTVVTAALWYSYPAWLKIVKLAPRRLRLPRWRRRAKRERMPKAKRAGWNWRRLLFWRRWRKRDRPARPTTTEPAIEIPATAPDLATADRLAAEGRYREAIRQRLRDTVTDLTRAGVVEPQPGWTAAELSAVAAANRPPLGPALGGATELFSEVWYGRLDARADDDDRMRRLTGEVRSALGARR